MSVYTKQIQENRTHKGELHTASIFHLEEARVRNSTLDVQDDTLIAKLSAGNIVAQGTLYHSGCLAALYNKSSTAQHTEGEEAENKTGNISHGVAEMITYIEVR